MKRDDFAEKFPGTLAAISNGHVAFVPNELPPDLRMSRELLDANDLATLALGELRAIVPSPVEQMNEDMKNIEIYIDNPTADLPTLVQIAIIHYQFEVIHPFADGNGRLGRLLISLLLSAWKILPEPLLYLSAFFSRNRDQYVSLLWEVSRRGAWSEWIMFFLEGVRQEAVDAVRRSRKLLDLREQYRKQLQTQRGSSSLFLLVDSLFVGPWTTVPRAVDVLGMSYNGAKKNIERLLQADILAKIQTGRRTKWYFAPKIMSILEAETA